MGKIVSDLTPRCSCSSTMTMIPVQTQAEIVIPINQKTWDASVHTKETMSAEINAKTAPNW